MNPTRLLLDAHVAVVDELVSDPLPRWHDLSQAEAILAALASDEATAKTAAAQLDVLADLRRRYLTWDSPTARAVRAAAGLLAVDGLPAVFSSQQLEAWHPPCAAGAPRAWQAWLSAVLHAFPVEVARGAAARADETVGVASAVCWERLVDDLVAATADERATALVLDWPATSAGARPGDFFASLVMEAVAWGQPVFLPDDPSEALVPLEGPAVLLAARAQVRGLPLVVISAGDAASSAEPGEELLRAVRDPRLRAVLLAASSSRAPRDPSQPLRTIHRL